MQEITGQIQATQLEVNTGTINDRVVTPLTLKNSTVNTATQTALDGKVAKSDYTTSHSFLVQQSGTGSPSALQIGNNTLVGRLSGGGSDINDLSVSDVKGLLSVENVDNTSDLNKPISTATQTALNAKQDTLVSATNIKTINGSSVLGSGDLAFEVLTNNQKILLDELELRIYN